MEVQSALVLEVQCQEGLQLGHPFSAESIGCGAGGTGHPDTSALAFWDDILHRGKTSLQAGPSMILVERRNPRLQLLRRISSLMLKG